MRTYEPEELEILENEIKENTEWLSTVEGDEVECIGIENLEAILNRFLELRQNKLNLTQ